MKGSSSYSYSKIPSHDLSGLSGFSVDKPVISSPSPLVDLPLVTGPQAHFDAFSKYLASYLAKELSDHRSSAREKLQRLTRQQFHELSTDVYDELMRRNANSVRIQDPFLPFREEYHPKRNQARQKLATLPTSRFQDLASDVHHELVRRYPEYKGESSGASLTLPGSTYDNVPSPGFPNAPRVRDRDPFTPTRLRSTSENPPSVGAVAI